jgi:hypothetical protein
MTAGRQIGIDAQRHPRTPFAVVLEKEVHWFVRCDVQGRGIGCLDLGLLPAAGPEARSLAIELGRNRHLFVAECRGFPTQALCGEVETHVQTVQFDVALGGEPGTDLSAAAGDRGYPQRTPDSARASDRHIASQVIARVSDKMRVRRSPRPVEPAEFHCGNRLPRALHGDPPIRAETQPPHWAVRISCRRGGHLQCHSQPAARRNQANARHESSCLPCSARSICQMFTANASRFESGAD